MKNKCPVIFAVITAFVVTLLVIGLSGCTLRGTKNYESNTGRLVSVPNERDLYYDTETGVVYFVFNEFYGNRGYGYMSAYYAPNGLPYLYKDGKLVEVENER